jgi:hypothetical protein
VLTLRAQALEKNALAKQQESNDDEDGIDASLSKEIMDLLNEALDVYGLGEKRQKTTEKSSDLVKIGPHADMQAKVLLLQAKHHFLMVLVMSVRERESQRASESASQREREREHLTRSTTGIG